MFVCLLVSSNGAGTNGFAWRRRCGVTEPTSGLTLRTVSAHSVLTRLLSSWMLIASGDKRGFITSAGWVLREKGTGGSRQPVGATLPVFASRLFKMAGRTASVDNGEVAHYCTFRVMACSRSQPTVVYHRIMSYLDQAICAFSLLSTRVLEGRFKFSSFQREQRVRVLRPRSL